MTEIVEHECRALGHRRAAAVDRAGSRDRRPGDVHRLHGRHRQAGRTRRRRRAHLRLGRRRDERQHPHRALRRRLLLHAGRRAVRRAPPVLARVVGKHCEAGDIVVKDEFLPGDVAPGRPARGAGHRRLLPVDGLELQPRAAPAGDRGAGRRSRGSSCGGRLRTTCWQPTWVIRVSEAVTRSAGRCGWPCSAAARWAPRWCGCCRSRPSDLAARIGRAGRAGRGRRTPPRRRRARSRCPRGCSPPTRDGLVARDDVDVVVEVIGGIEPARAPDPRGAGARRRRWSPPTRRCWPRTARPCSRPPRRPAATSTTRPPSPVPSRSCARCASRWPATGSPGCSASSTAPPTSSSTRWTPSGAGFDEALEEAQELGYAEADPTADVEGFDAAAKAAILASLAFHTRVTAADVYREGITEVTAADVASAREMGCVVKLLAIAELRVHGRRRGGRRGARAPGDDPALATRWPRCARPSTRSSSSPRPPAS